MTPLFFLFQEPIELPEEFNQLYEWGGVIVIAAIIFFYFLPSIIALFRGKKNVIAIMALNFFLGCTVIGWVVSLVWSLSADAKPHTVVVNQKQPQNQDNLEQLAKLKKLLDDGAISEQEYIIEKNKLLKK